MINPNRHGDVGKKPGGKKGKVTRIVSDYDREVAVVKGWLGGRLEAALSLKKLHDEKLWQGHYPSFDELCEEEFGVSRTYAYGLLKAADAKESIAQPNTLGEVSSIQDKISNVSQALALADVPEEKRIEVVEKVVKSGKKVTAKSIAAAAQPETIEAPTPAPPRAVIATCKLCRKKHDLTMDCPKDDPVPTVENAPIERAPEPRTPVIVAEGESNEWWIILPPEESAKVNEMMLTFGFTADEVFRQAVRMLGGMD